MTDHLHYNTLILSKDNYAEETAFWRAVADTLRLLTNNHYTTTFRYEDCGIYAIDFDYADAELANAIPVWLTPDEAEEVVARRQYDLD